MKTSKIILLGYMGSGKTTVGKKLKEKLNVPFWDLDDYIEQKFNSTISSIFKLRGEMYFREKERQALEDLLENDKRMIISLGGGTPCYYDNMEYLISFEDVKTFYLHADVETISKRLELEKDKRPLISHLKNMDEINDFVGKHLFERKEFYTKADFMIYTKKKSVKNIALELEKLLT